MFKPQRVKSEAKIEHVSQGCNFNQKLRKIFNKSKKLCGYLSSHFPKQSSLERILSSCISRKVLFRLLRWISEILFSESGGSSYLQR